MASHGCLLSSGLRERYPPFHALRKGPPAYLLARRPAVGLRRQPPEARFGFMPRAWRNRTWPGRPVGSLCGTFSRQRATHKGLMTMPFYIRRWCSRVRFLLRGMSPGVYCVAILLARITSPQSLISRLSNALAAWDPPYDLTGLECADASMGGGPTDVSGLATTHSGGRAS
jgi:hypothetical protein